MAAFKVNITKNGNAIKFQFTDSDHYLYGNGEVEVPVNSLSLVIDESDFVTFKKASTNDTFITFNPANSNLSDKAGVIEFYKTNMVGSTGGGSESGITPSEVQEMIDNSLEDYYTDDEVDAALSGKASASDVTALENDVSTLSGQVATKVAITDFNAYSAATDSRLAEDEEVTAAALNDLQENKADTSAVTQEISAAISGKADTSAVTAVNDALTAHTANTTVHVTSAEKTAWNAKQDALYIYTEDNNLGTAELHSNDSSIIFNAGGASITANNPLGINTFNVAGTGVTINGENVLTDGIISTAITSGSTDSEIPTAKATYEAITAATTGGGATYSAGTNISIDTANTINCTIPAYFNADERKGDIAIGTNINNVHSDYYKVVIGRQIDTYGNSNSSYSIGIGPATNNTSQYSQLKGNNSVGIGKYFQITAHQSVAIGSEAKSSVVGGVAIGYGVDATGTTKMNLNNQIKVDTNNQVYIKDKTNTTDVCIQDAIAALGGLKLVKLTQNEYDQLATKDPDTLYIISNVVS